MILKTMQTCMCMWYHYLSVPNSIFGFSLTTLQTFRLFLASLHGLSMPFKVQSNKKTLAMLLLIYKTKWQINNMECSQKTAFIHEESVKAHVHLTRFHAKPTCLIFNSSVSFGKVKGVNKRHFGYFSFCFVFLCTVVVVEVKVLGTVALRK